jgi:L-alanine-DL-glutamate epimerase-like enolase superfamily enzyme
MSLIKELRMSKLRIPFRVSFRHANATRSATESVWLEAVDFDGHVGYGESCPRSYVTGEDLESCSRFFLEHRDGLRRRVGCLADLREWVTTHRTEIDQSPAAWCAIELALLDLLARRERRSLEALLGVPELDGIFHYTGVVGDQSKSAFSKQVTQYREMGFEQFKVKLSGEQTHDAAKFAILSSEGTSAEHVRVDANNLWKTASDATSYLLPMAASFCAIEEPLSAGDYDGMRQLSESLGKLMILDESFLRIDQFSLIDVDRQRWLINLRISKMGGLLRSLEVARRAVENGIGLIVGAQVGETSLLTRAALTVAHVARPVLKGQEGAFGTFLLQADVMDPPLTFGNRGRISATNSALRSPCEIIRPTAFLKELQTHE